MEVSMQLKMEHNWCEGNKRRFAWSCYKTVLDKKVLLDGAVDKLNF